MSSLSTTPPTHSFSKASTPDAVGELIAHLQAENASLKAENATLRETVSTLSTRVADLERQLSLHSGNSNKPPSSDGLKKPRRTTSLREPSKRKSGGQPGHKGETLRQVAEPDVVVDHYPTSCTNCGSDLTQDTATTFSARQIFDLPEPQPLIVTEHRAHSCCCAKCGAIAKATFPEDVKAPAQYGKRLAATVTYLYGYQFIPEDRMAELMLHLFGICLATDTIAHMCANSAQRFQGFVGIIYEYIKAAALKNLDETGLHIGGKLRWLHVAATELFTFYRVSHKRGSMFAGLTGIVIHDHWKSYYTLKGVIHALCNAHHLRELKALAEIEKERWAIRMRCLLRRACHATNLARERSEPLSPRLLELFRRRYDVIVATGMEYHEQLPLLPKTGSKGRQPCRTGHNLLMRLKERKADVLLFLTDPRVPFTNNLAEQAMRMMKVRQKISGGFRTEQGAEDFATIRSLISTAKKQGWNVIETLSDSLENLLSKLRLG